MNFNDLYMYYFHCSVMSNDQYQRMPDQQPTGPDGQGNNPG